MPDPEWMNKIEIYLSIVLSPLFENWARLGRIDEYSQMKKKVENVHVDYHNDLKKN